MTIQDIINMDKNILTPADVAPLLGCNPDMIRWQAKNDPSKLGFPVSRIGTRTKIPRLAFIEWFNGGRYDSGKYASNN